MKKTLAVLCALIFIHPLLALSLAEDAYQLPEFKKADLNAETDDKAVRIVLDDGGTVIDGSGAACDGRVVRITSGGVYLIEGSLTDGQIVVDVGKSAKVRLILNGASVENSRGPALYVLSADKTTLTLAEGTVNTFADGAKYDLAEGEDEPNACVFSKDDLSINGNGALKVTGNYLHGINCKDDLKIASGTIEVVSAVDGIRGKDSLSVIGGSIRVTAGKDGMKSGNESDPWKGIIWIGGGSIEIGAENDGLQAAQALAVTDGEVTVTSGGGSAAAAEETGTERFYRSGGWGRQTGWDRSHSAEDAPSKKGLKSDGLIAFTGGRVTVDSDDDSVHADGPVTVSGGQIALSSGDDGVHSDEGISVLDGELRVLSAYEGLEAPVIDILGGTVFVVSTDDGISCAGGSQGTESVSRWGGPGWGMPADADPSNILTVSGGFLYVNSGGDGLDSNGYIYIRGGTVFVDGPTNSMNGALDSGCGIIVSGGTLAAAGAAGMAEAPSEASTQLSLFVCADPEAFSSLAVVDEAGGLLLACAFSRACECCVISSSLFEKNASCRLLAGSDVEGLVPGSLVTGGSVSGGTELGTVLLSDTVTWFGGKGHNGRPSFPDGGPGGGHGRP